MSTFTARLVGGLTAVAVSIGAVLFLVTQRWATLDFGGMPLPVVGALAAAVLGAALGPRLRKTTHGLDTAILMTLAVVPVTALLAGLLGSVDAIRSGLDVPLLAPIGIAFFGLFIIGPAGLLVALPAAVVWSQATRLLLQRLGNPPVALTAACDIDER